MPPRISVFQCLRTRAQNAAATPPSKAAPHPFSPACSSRAASTVTQRRRHRDPWAIAQAKAKQAANRSRQEVLEKERASALGDPVRGVTTPFVTSFDTALPPEPSSQQASKKSGDVDSGPTTLERNKHLNFYLTKEELETGISRSRWLSSPLPSAEPEPSDVEDSEADAEAKTTNEQLHEIMDLIGNDQSEGAGSRGAPKIAADFVTESTPRTREAKLQEEHDTAGEALRRIASLSLASSKDRLRVNKARCVEVFGRHNTDGVLPPKLASVASTVGTEEKTPRVGPDTGSSEVQIAILTAKIRAVADFLDTRGTMDKVNKRNLRLLVHRRAKLLKYLRRKDRGGPRWQNLVEKLGLVDGTWKGEISL